MESFGLIDFAAKSFPGRGRRRLLCYATFKALTGGAAFRGKLSTFSVFRVEVGPTKKMRLKIKVSFHGELLHSEDSRVSTVREGLEPDKKHCANKAVKIVIAEKTSKITSK